jgi:hypothetical protein
MTRRPSLHEITAVTAALALASVAVLSMVGDGIRRVLVGAAGWKEWMVDDRLSVVFLVAVATAALTVRALVGEWRLIGADHHRRRRWNLTAFAVAVATPMMLVNARSLGRLIVFDHPRKDLGWKKELIDVAGWLSDHRPGALVVVAAVAVAVSGRSSATVDAR